MHESLSDCCIVCSRGHTHCTSETRVQNNNILITIPSIFSRHFRTNLLHQPLFRSVVNDLKGKTRPVLSFSVCVRLSVTRSWAQAAPLSSVVSFPHKLVAEAVTTDPVCVAKVA